MTIDSDWVEVMKGECPEAFTPEPPIRPRAVYIDGMPLLMAGPQTRMWDDLVKRNFAFPIMRYYRMGASTVVLAFDDYRHVPAAKSITQANRSKGKAPFVFGDGQNLESVIPEGYNDRLRNRVYKRRVIDLIVEMLPDCTRLREVTRRAGNVPRHTARGDSARAAGPAPRRRLRRLPGALPDRPKDGRRGPLVHGEHPPDGRVRRQVHAVRRPRCAPTARPHTGTGARAARSHQQSVRVAGGPGCSAT